MKYDLSHLIQNSDQMVLGPIQDDEALLLFALCKVMMIKNIIEIGVLDGYSTNNFIKAVGENGNVIGIDINDVQFKSKGFTFIKSCVSMVDPNQIPWNIDLIFFDSHAEEAQKIFYNNMVKGQKITDETIIAIHDTNLHPKGFNIGSPIEDGFAHQPAERSFSNWLISMGYTPFHMHTNVLKHNKELPFRHGLTLLSRKCFLS